MTILIMIVLIIIIIFDIMIVGIIIIIIETRLQTLFLPLSPLLPPCHHLPHHHLYNNYQDHYQNQDVVLPYDETARKREHALEFARFFSVPD